MSLHRFLPSWTTLASPTPSHPSRLSRSSALSSPCYTAPSHWLSIVHTVVYMCQCYSLNSIPLSPWASLVAQTVKNLPAMQKLWFWSLGQEDPLEEEMATHSSILAWRIPWREEPGGLQSKGSQRVGHDWATNTNSFHHCIHKSVFCISIPALKIGISTIFLDSVYMC